MIISIFPSVAGSVAGTVGNGARAVVVPNSNIVSGLGVNVILADPGGVPRVL